MLDFSCAEIETDFKESVLQLAGQRARRRSRHHYLEV